MKLFWQKNAKFSIAKKCKIFDQTPMPPAAGGFAPKPPLTSADWMLHRPPKQPPNCEFLATRLRNTVVRFRTKSVSI